jgi:multimeric flavodoxin WrbA
MHERGVASRHIWIQQALRADGGLHAMLREIDAADVVVLAAPLYVDSLPADVMKAFEVIARERAQARPSRTPAFVAIVNCGFPESRHNDTALAIVKRFAGAAGLAWAGGLALGGGASLDGRPLATAPAMFRNVRASLDSAAEALAEGRPVSDEAVALMARKLCPSWLYTLVGTIGWRRHAREFGAKKRMRDKPYQSSS